MIIVRIVKLLIPLNWVTFGRWLGIFIAHLDDHQAKIRFKLIKKRGGCNFWSSLIWKDEFETKNFCRNSFYTGNEHSAPVTLKSRLNEFFFRIGSNYLTETTMANPHIKSRRSEFQTGAKTNEHLTVTLVQRMVALELFELAAHIRTNPFCIFLTHVLLMQRLLLVYRMTVERIAQICFELFRKFTNSSICLSGFKWSI